MSGYIGMGVTTGQALHGIDHLRQSVRDILTTPLGSRVMRRDYGSALPALVDANVTDLTIAQLYAATADALARWEPRLHVTKVALDTLTASRVGLTIDAIYLPEGREIRIDGVIL